VEVEKWKKFGKLMADSYDELNKKFNNFLKEQEKDRKIIGALKDQVNTLKSLLTISQDENSKLKDGKFENNMNDGSTQLTTNPDDKDTARLREQIEQLKQENEKLSRGANLSNKHKEDSHYYKALSDAKFKECSSLAEEIICLRTDLDRSHSNFLRVQREQKTGNSDNNNMEKSQSVNSSAHKKYRKQDSSETMLLNMMNGANRSRNVKLKDDTEEEPPTPEKFIVCPASE